MTYKMKNVLQFIFIFMWYSSVSSKLNNNEKHVITLFEHGNFIGVSANISIARCSNLPLHIRSKVTSVNSHGNCARLFEETDCSGGSIEMEPTSPSHYSLRSWNFNDKANSVGPCQSDCAFEVTGKIEREIKVEIYTRTQYKGVYTVIHGTACEHVPNNFIGRIQAIKTISACIQLYDNHNCIEKDTLKLVQLRRNSNFAEDFSKWNFPEVKSMSHCRYKCDNMLASSNSTDPENVKRAWLKLKPDKCINLDFRWEGVPVSVDVDNSSCVTLYDHHDCFGTFHVVLSVNEDLSFNNFDGRTRSLNLCGRDKRKIVSKPLPITTASTLISSPTHITIITVSLTTGLVILAFIVLFVVKKYCYLRAMKMNQLSENEISEFLNGGDMDIDVTNTNHTTDYPVEVLAKNRPYNHAFEIPRSQILFDSKVPLGSDEFGVVYKGTLLAVHGQVKGSDRVSEGNATAVAIKTAKLAAGTAGLRSILKEVKVMLYVGNHPNIARLIGCCTGNIAKGEILVVIEFCCKGSLDMYLQHNRLLFKNVVRKGKIESLQLQMFDFENNQDGLRFDLFQIMKWSIEVARAMEFLSNAKVVHSDLAARNILLDESLNAKISDFGLSRQLYNYTKYVKKKQEPLPWRWMALESLTRMEFSLKSDVWSFGVLCWEMFTLGDKPYPGIVWSENFVFNLSNGMRLNKPINATREFYNLMIRCWDEDVLVRPSFSRIVAEIEEMRFYYRSSAQL